MTWFRRFSLFRQHSIPGVLELCFETFFASGVGGWRRCKCQRCIGGGLCFCSIFWRMFHLITAIGVGVSLHHVGILGGYYQSL